MLILRPLEGVSVLWLACLIKNRHSTHLPCIRSHTKTDCWDNNNLGTFFPFVTASSSLSSSSPSSAFFAFFFFTLLSSSSSPLVSYLFPVVFLDVEGALPRVLWDDCSCAHSLHLPATFTRQFQALLQNTSTLLISGSDDHTLFLWSLFPSSLVNTNTKTPPLQHAQTATNTKYPTSNSHQMIEVIRAYYATLECLLHSAGHWVRDCPPYKYARVHAYSTVFREATCFHMTINVLTM